LLKSDSKQSVQSESLEKIKSSFKDDNINKKVKLLESGADSDLHLIGNFANSKLSVPQRQMMKSNNLMEFYQNLFILRTVMSFDFINKRFMDLFGPNLELDERFFRIEPIPEYTILSNGCVGSFRYLFDSTKKRIEKEIGNGITDSLKLSNNVKSKVRSMIQFFPLEFKSKAKINPLCEVFQDKLFVLIKNKDTEGIQNLLNEMNFILLNSSSSVKDDKVKLVFYYDRETFELTFLPRKEDCQNLKTAEIVYETVSNSETFMSYNEFLNDFKNKLKEQLQTLYRFHLENVIDPDSGFLTDGSQHVFLSNADAVKSELVSILNRTGLHSSNYSLKERIKLAELISEILTKQN
jgi:hypothetical protein